MLRLSPLGRKPFGWALIGAVLQTGPQRFLPQWWWAKKFSELVEVRPTHWLASSTRPSVMHRKARWTQAKQTAELQPATMHVWEPAPICFQQLWTLERQCAEIRLVLRGPCGMLRSLE